jgi:4'-phosphopantetheinyl transferase
MTDTEPRPLHWQAVPKAPSLLDTEVHLWRLRLDRGDQHSDTADMALLSAEQRARLQRLRSPLHRQRWLRVQAGCRRILGSYVGAAADRLVLCYGPAGKPMLAGPRPGPEFNLTTTGDLALLAISARLPVGVDCEFERERAHLLDIARRMLGPDTERRLAAMDGPARRRAFFLHWTALEARVKADGRGLARYRQPDLPGLAIGHALAGVANGRTAICAVARQSLPPPALWRTLEMQHD